MRQFMLNYIPTPIFILLIIFIIMALSFLTYKILRLYFKSYLLRKARNFTIVYQIITTGTTLLVAFLIVMLWQTFLTAKGSVNEEVGALSKMVMNSKVFPQNDQDKIRRAIKQYAQIVITQEWPLMKWGKSSREATAAMDNIYHVLESSMPQSQNQIQQVFYKEMIANYNTALESRYSRMDRLESVIPGPLFAMTAVYILILALSVCLIELQERKALAILVFFVNCVLGTDLALLVSFDYPFAGDISVSNKAFSEKLIQKI